ncbi:MAG: flagellar biosynthesis protein FlhA [Deltaproteobacteria bacterium]|nr:flagellar biosynthesis protein FlhA [Deltaproteobacteria bacterium]
MFGIQDTAEIIEELGQRYPSLVREVVPRVVGINTLSEILRNLLSEGVPIKNMKSILENIERYAHFEKNPHLLTEFVRVSLSGQICQNLSRDRHLMVYLLSKEISKIVFDSFADIGGEQVLSISPENARRIIEAVRNTGLKQGRPIVILTEFELRRFVKKIIEYEFPFASVISFKEISPCVRIEPAGVIDLSA